MKKLITALALVIVLPCVVHAETLTLSTYYPSPFGVYNQLRLVPQNPDPACAAGLDGLMWINSTGELRYCFNGLQSVPPGVWKQDDGTNSVYVTDLDPGSTNYNNALEVGLGLADPNANFHVHESTANSGSVIRVTTNETGTTNNDGVTFGYQVFGGPFAFIFNEENTPFVLATNNIVRMTVAADGNVGIGTGLMTPVSNLTIENNVATGAIDTFGEHQIVLWTDSADPILGTYGFGIRPGTQVYKSAGAHQFDQGSNTRVTITSVGEVGIGTTTPSAMLDVLGNATIQGDLLVSNGATGTVEAHAFFYLSDENLKENIHPTNGLKTIMQLEGVEFNWKDSGKKGMGLIAQDVEKVLPVLVQDGMKSNSKSIQYGNLVAPLIEAIKEQQAQIESLKNEIEELKANRF